MAIVKGSKWAAAMRNVTQERWGVETTPLRKLIKKMPGKPGYILIAQVHLFSSPLLLQLSPLFHPTCTLSAVAEEVFNRCTMTNSSNTIHPDSPEYRVIFNYEFIEDLRDKDSRTRSLHRAVTR